MKKQKPKLRNIGWWISSGAFIVMMTPSNIPSLAGAAILCLALLVLAQFLPQINVYARKPNKLSITFALLLSAFSGFNFFTMWKPSSMLAGIAGKLGLSINVFLAILAVCGGLVSLYSMTALCNLIWIEIIVQDASKEKAIIATLKRNWYFPISALAFFCLNLDNNSGYVVGISIAVGFSIYFAVKTPFIGEKASKSSLAFKILCSISAAGICLGEQSVFYAKVQKLLLPESLNHFFYALSLFGALAAFVFVYLCLSYFWAAFLDILEKTSLFKDIKASEVTVYTLLLLLTLVLTIVAFSQTQAFYGSDPSYDVIYTSDSGVLVSGNVYLSLSHSENDLRQPLFAVFSAPFIGIPYLISRFFDAIPFVQAALVNSVQILLLFLANLILARMMNLSSEKRICFMILACCTYTHLLFSLMMEQYIIAYFWLILCLYLIFEKKQLPFFAFCAAGGTLLTSAILLPFSSAKSAVSEFKLWFKDIVRQGLGFVCAILAFSRADIFTNLLSRIAFLSTFSGQSVTLVDKTHQYTAFIANCFFAPLAGVNTTFADHISWQLDVISDNHPIGITILILCLVSILIHRHNKCCQIAAGWIVFSGVMLLVLGWGTRENGLILYSLYFGWAFLVLLFQLLDTFAKRLSAPVFLPIFSLVISLSLLYINVPAIVDMMNFAITYYPT